MHKTMKIELALFTTLNIKKYREREEERHRICNQKENIRAAFKKQFLLSLILEV